MPFRGTVNAGTGGKVGTLNQAAVVLGGVDNKGAAQSSASADELGKQDFNIDVNGPKGDLEVVGTLNQTWLAEGGMSNTPDKGSEAPVTDKTGGYKMDAEPRGLCLLFNNKTFEGKENRTGTDNDRDELKRVFEKLKFQVKVLDNADADVMELKVRKLSESSHKEYDCVIVIFLTHGKDGAVKGSDNEWLRINTITSFFKAGVCPTLANKPKLFFFQSCRGDVFQKGAKVEGDENTGAVGGMEMERLVAPEADFFFGYSTVPGTKSVRNVETGSWYIQELIRALDGYADKEDLQTLMTRVASGVNEHMAECEDGTFIRQTAEFSSRLLKPLYF